MDILEEKKIIELFNKREKDNTKISEIGTIKEGDHFKHHKIIKIIKEEEIEFFSLETSKNVLLIKIKKEGHVTFKDLLSILKTLKKPIIYILLLSVKEKLEIYKFEDQTETLF